jgi:hypothetical protein
MTMTLTSIAMTTMMMTTTMMTMMMTTMTTRKKWKKKSQVTWKILFQSSGVCAGDFAVQIVASDCDL